MFALLILLLQSTAVTALTCYNVPGRLKQVDACNGQVYGVASDGNVYSRSGAGWRRMAGSLSHVSVGPAGVWGVGPNQELYRMVQEKWVVLAGTLSQIDAGGDLIVAGVDNAHDIFCSNRAAAVSAHSFSSPDYSRVPGKLKYYSCGPYSCWGIDPSGMVQVRLNVRDTNCVGTTWRQVNTRMAVIEVASDGTVYGVNHLGLLYHRIGTTTKNPLGRTWKKVHIMGKFFRHVTSDLGELWLIEKDGKILHCR